MNRVVERWSAEDHSRSKYYYGRSMRVALWITAIFLIAVAWPRSDELGPGLALSIVICYVGAGVCIYGATVWHLEISENGIADRPWFSTSVKLDGVAKLIVLRNRAYVVREKKTLVIPPGVEKKNEIIDRIRQRVGEVIDSRE